MTKIDIFSGFLGAGKTTLIRKLIDESFKGEKLVLIENEFGEINIDSGFLKDAGVEITELSSGCICCTLVGDFGEALKKVIAEFAPDRILIEPSGVGKLSDVIRAVQQISETEDIILNSFVAVADAKKCKMYMKNFGEFYMDQIEHAKTIVLSRTQDLNEEQLAATVELLKEHNPEVRIITTPWDNLSGNAILEAMEGDKSFADKVLELIKNEPAHEHHHHHDDHDGCHDHDEHEHHHDEHDCCHDHDEHEHHHHDEHDCCHDHDEHEHHHHDEHDGCHDHDEHEHHHHDEHDGCHDHDGHEHHHHDEHDCCHDHDEHEHHHHDEHDGCHDHDEHEHHHHDEHDCCHDHDEHEHHHHDEHDCCHDHDGHGHHHDHDADEVFDSWGRETLHKYSKSSLEEALSSLDYGLYGAVLRAKGIVQSDDDKWLHFDYVPGELQIREGSASYTGQLCVIGCELKADKLAELFNL